MNFVQPQPTPQEQDLLARFVMDARWIRNIDQTIKPEAFMPHPELLDLSVTCHTGLTVHQIWDAGKKIAAQRTKLLLGRADVVTAVVKQQSLTLRPDPTTDNPNHACIIGWPNDKSAQKSIAQQLAAASTLHRQ